MNNVSLVGNLTKNPELGTTNGGVSFCRFTLAVTRNYSKDGQQEADFLPIVVWRVQAENCAKYLRKGSKAGVTGEIQTRTYDAQDGTRRYVTEIIASRVEFLSPKSQNTESNNTNLDSTKTDDTDDDDLPF